MLHQIIALLPLAECVVTLNEGVCICIRVANLGRGQHLQTSIQHLQRLILLTFADKLHRNAGKRLAGTRCAEIILREVVGVNTLLGKVTVAEYIFEQRICYIGIYAANIPRRAVGGKNRHKTICVAVKLQIIEQAEILQDIYLREAYRTIPIEVSQQVEQHHLALFDALLALRDVDIYGIYHQVVVLLLYDARLYGVLLVYGDSYATRGDVVHHCAIYERELCRFVLALDELHQLVNLHNAVYSLAYGQSVVHERILTARQAEGHGGSVVSRSLHLVDVPLATQVA